MVETMEIQKGFKKTEVGIIPSDWSLCSIGEIFDVTAGGDFKRKESSDYKNEKHQYPIYSNSLANYGLYGYCSYYTSEANCITVTARGTVGHANYRDHRFTAIGRVLVLLPKNKNDVDCFFTSEFINNRINFILEVTGVPQLTAPQVSKYLISFPPTKAEQTAIATALNDADALITQLEKLIAKKRAIKQGSVLELLTGKKRLLEFSGKWETKKLGDICDIKTGKKDVNQGNPDGDYPFFTCSRESTYSDEYSFDGEAILIAGNGEVGNLHYFVGKFEAYQRTYVLQDFSVGTKYLWYQLDSFFKNSLGIGTIGSSIPYIKKENIAEFIFSTPKEESEQIAIAAILSDMDAEIERLEKKLEKYKMLKQGMMQNLLTGKIRLI